MCRLFNLNNVRTQIAVIDHVRDRLKVPSVHTIGYCVAGTTLAATLAILARRGEQDKVRSTTFFTAQVDFELPEELVTQETQNQADAMVKRGVQSGMSEDEIESQQTEIFASAGSQAVSNLRTNFILQEIARVEKITVTDAELVNHLVQIANSRKVAPKKFIKDMQRAGRIPNIRSSMAIGKTIDFLVEHANVAESTETPLDD